METGFAGLHRPPPSPCEPRFCKSSPGRPFLRGFPRPVLARFGLFGFSPSLVVIFAALSLHPKIPFLADKYRDRSGDFGTGKIVVIAAD